MKELSIDQKAKRYDEALKIAKKNYKTAQDLCEGSQIGVEYFKNTLTNIFPELKESEDERIRKELCKAIWTYIPTEEGQEYIAWLEKQGEKKHKFIIGDIISNNNAIYRVDNIVKNCIGQDCYFLVNVECEKNGTRYLKLFDSDGKTHNMGEITWICEQVDAKFEKQGDQESTDFDILIQERIDALDAIATQQNYTPKFKVGERLKYK